MSYKVFVRNWWRKNPNWKPSLFNRRRTWQNGGLIPDPGARKTTLRTGLTEAEAWQLCQDYEKTHAPGLLSRKAEYTKE